MKKLSYRIAEKSLNAALAALEIYNKPDCKYREENFCILMINAFELLFKSKIVKENNEDIRNLYVYYNPKRKNGSLSKQKLIKKNRIGEPLTIDINRCMNILSSNKIITNNLVENVNLLIEIRDNAIHLINDNKIVTKLYSICAGSIRNYTKIFERWVPEIKLSNYNFFITPLNFDLINKKIDVASLNIAQKNFLSYIDLASSVSEENDDFELLVKVDIKFIKTDNADDAILLKYASEGKKINVELTEDMFKKMYPFEYSQIVTKIKKKQKGIKVTNLFNKIKKSMQEEEICCRARYLNFISKKGAKKYYYNSGFVDKFLERYNKEEVK